MFIMFVSLLRILVFVETWNLNWEFVILEILDFELRMCRIGNLDFIFWLHFGIGQQQIDAANSKKKCTYQRSCGGNRADMCSFCILWNILCHFSTRFLKNHGGMLYFPSRLYNRVCIFSTFYRGWIKRSCTTTLVSLIQPQLITFFLLVAIVKYLLK